MNRFWNWVKNEAESAEPAELRLNGAIAEDRGWKMMSRLLSFGQNWKPIRAM